MGGASVEFGSTVFAGTVGCGLSDSRSVAEAVGIMVAEVPPLGFKLVAEGDAVQASVMVIATTIRPILKFMTNSNKRLLGRGKSINQRTIMPLVISRCHYCCQEVRRS